MRYFLENDRIKVEIDSFGAEVKSVINKNNMREYSRIKMEGAKLYPHDIDAYIEHKSSLIESIYREIGV